MGCDMNGTYYYIVYYIYYFVVTEQTLSKVRVVEMTTEQGI